VETRRLIIRTNATRSRTRSMEKAIRKPGGKDQNKRGKGQLVATI